MAALDVRPPLPQLKHAERALVLQVRALFEVAAKVEPSVIFIDEIDSLWSARSEGDPANIGRGSQWG
jgi:hypothetical protein